MLTREHVIPLALNGSLIIENAACDPCRDKTNKGYENFVLQNELLNARLILGLDRRRKKVKGPKYLHPITKSFSPFDLNGKNPEPNLRQLGDEAKRVLMLVRWAPPTLLSGSEAEGFEGFQLGLFNLGSHPPQVAPREFGTFPANLSLYSLFLIKVAYGFAVSEIGIHNFDGSLARDFLNNLRGEGYVLVGGASHPNNISESLLHRLSYRQEKGWIVVTVHLFASAIGVRYDVVVGRA